MKGGGREMIIQERKRERERDWLEGESKDVLSQDMTG